MLYFWYYNRICCLLNLKTSHYIADNIINNAAESFMQVCGFDQKLLLFEVKTWQKKSICIPLHTIANLSKGSKTGFDILIFVSSISTHVKVLRHWDNYFHHNKHFYFIESTNLCEICQKRLTNSPSFQYTMALTLMFNFV